MAFDAEYPDPLHPDNTRLSKAYFDTDKEYSGRITVPVLFDNRYGYFEIVSNQNCYSA